MCVYIYFEKKKKKYIIFCFLNVTKDAGGPMFRYKAKQSKASKRIIASKEMS